MFSIIDSWSYIIENKSLSSFKTNLLLINEKEKESSNNQKKLIMSIKSLSTKSKNNKNYFILIYLTKLLILYLLSQNNQNYLNKNNYWPTSLISKVYCQKVTHLNNNNNNNNFQKQQLNIAIPLNNIQQHNKHSTNSARSNLFSTININNQNLNSDQQQHSFNNITPSYQLSHSASNRPLERPSLSLVNNNNNNNNNNGNVTLLLDDSANNNQSVETPADWLMMEGGNDLLLEEGKSVASFVDSMKTLSSSTSTRRSGSAKRNSKNGNKNSGNNSSKSIFDDDSVASAESSSSSDSNDVLDDVDDGGGSGGGGSSGGSSIAGTSKEPDCASHGRYYCTYKEEYPLKLVTEVTKYYKWPLEKLFRDLHAQIMPKLAQDSTGNLVCDSITRVVRPGWARNTNERWLVVINTENYHQYVTEVVCQYGSNSRCNFIPPCYYSSCQQRYNTQKLLVIDPSNPYRGPFLSEFLFPSCCVCYVPSAGDSFQDKYRSSPATIYQRTMQQESANNLYPPQFKPTGLLEDQQASLINQNQQSSLANDHHSSSSRVVQSSSSASPSSMQQQQQSNVVGINPSQAINVNSQKDPNGGGALSSPVQIPNQAPGPGEIRRRAGELHHRQQQQQQQQQQQRELHGNTATNEDMDGFPRLGLIDSLGVNNQQPSTGIASTSANSRK